MPEKPRDPGGVFERGMRTTGLSRNLGGTGCLRFAIPGGGRVTNLRAGRGSTSPLSDRTKGAEAVPDGEGN